MLANAFPKQYRMVVSSNIFINGQQSNYFVL